MANRQINTNALALGFSVQTDCTIRPLRSAALEHVIDVIQRHQGSTTRISAELGVSTSTYQKWCREVPELGRAHEKSRPSGKTYSEIGEALGVSKQRAHKMAKDGLLTKRGTRRKRASKS